MGGLLHFAELVVGVAIDPIQLEELCFGRFIAKYCVGLLVNNIINVFKYNCSSLLFKIP